MEKFLKALKDNPELMEELRKQTTEDGLYEVAKPYIDDMSKEDFMLSLRGLFSVGEKIQSGEVSEDDLEAASGGKGGGKAAGMGIAAGVMAGFSKLAPNLKDMDWSDTNKVVNTFVDAFVTGALAATTTGMTVYNQMNMPGADTGE